MLYKIVVGSQIRLFDCKDPLSLELLSTFITKNFPKLTKFSLYYIDEDGDHITLESTEDVSVFLEYDQKKPKIYVNEVAQEETVF